MMLGSNRVADKDRQAIMDAAGKLDERRQEQIRRQRQVINSLMVRINAFEEFCEYRDLEEEAKIFVAAAMVKAAGEGAADAESPTTATD